MEKLASKKEEEELAIMTTPKSCVTSQNVDHDNMMTPAKVKNSKPFYLVIILSFEHFCCFVSGNVR